MLVLPIYMYMRGSGEWTGDYAIETAIKLVGPERAQSLQTRIKAENVLVARVLDGSLSLGGERWDLRNRVYECQREGLWPQTDVAWVDRDWS